MQVEGPLRLDGRLDEPAWRRAPVHRLARQRTPTPGGPVTQTTTFRVVATRDAIYLGIRCDQTVPLVARRTRRDRAVESDRVTVDIDSRGRGKDAFHFEVTAGGTLVDGIRYNDTTIDLQWDGVWWAEVQRDAKGWTAEIEIPFRILRRPPKARPMRIQVRRYVSRLGETDEWAPTPRDGSREVSRYAPLEGIEFRARRLVADLYPYFSVGVALDTGDQVAASLVRRYGGNLKLRIGTDATVDATVLPDFGNVEADTAVFNLTTAELRFPEKRPFFQEGVDVLTTPLSVFYSRRIGSLSGTTAGNAVDAPPPAPVLGAAKLLWRVGKRGTLGALVAETGAQDVAVRSVDDGLTAPQRVLPYFTYALARGQIDLPNAGYVGLMAGGRVSFDRGPKDPWTVCPDLQAPERGSCFADAYFASADTLIRSRDGRYRAQGQVVGTLRWGGTPLAQIDGNVVRSGDMGGAARVRLEKAGGRMIGWIDYTWLGRDAEWNATGFLPVPHRHRLRAHLGWQTLSPHGAFLEERWQYEWVQRFNLDGLSMFEGYQLNHRAKWKSFWRHFVELHVRPRRWDDREARDGTPVERAGNVGLELELTSDHRRKVVWDLVSTTQVRTTGGAATYGWRTEVESSLDVIPSGPIQLRLGVNGTYDTGEFRWVETDPTDGVRRFARLRALALGALLRANYTVSPSLELQLYTQLLGAGTRYLDGHAVPMANTRVRLGALRPDPTFSPVRESEALWVMNLFLRWRFAPGSNLYVVLTRNQTDPTVPGGDGGLDLSQLGRMAASYLFLVKVVHRFAL
ncbi:MAG: hypothetical protein D6705_00475 [Deltaproteobacteria bacterium]|nr:MAG: hypothetical protein D6705_00475 [Deltaproteobacteria bacterium]